MYCYNLFLFNKFNWLKILNMLTVPFTETTFVSVSGWSQKETPNERVPRHLD